MFVSKHHYAIELAKRGNKVYFLNPPQKKLNRREKVLISQSELQENLYLIYHRLSFPYNLKFHFIRFFHTLMHVHVKKIVKLIESEIDITWSFDLGNLYPFSFFPDKSFKIFHPVDEPLNKTAINSAKGADVIFSVTKEILEKYSDYKVPKHFINHGIADDFIKTEITAEGDGKVRVGFSGNLLRNDIDRKIFLQIIKENPEVIIECWGSYNLLEGNIGGVEDDETMSFIHQLQQYKNVILHGVVPVALLATELLRMDAFLICYDIEKDQSKGTNYHKVMEYISTGKVIISNNITTFAEKPELVEMVMERDTNKKLPELFKAVTENLSVYNSAELQNKRLAFANDNTYKKQIDRIDEFIVKHLSINDMETDRLINLKIIEY